MLTASTEKTARRTKGTLGDAADSRALLATGDVAISYYLRLSDYRVLKAFNVGIFSTRCRERQLDWYYAGLRHRRPHSVVTCWLVPASWYNCRMPSFRVETPQHCYPAVVERNA